MDEHELRRRLTNYKFYHIIPLTPTISTPGEPSLCASQAPVLSAIERLDLRGKRVLDIGCRDGLYSLAAEQRGAAEVIGIDNDLSRGTVEVVLPWLKSRVRMHGLNVYDLTPDLFGAFDVVIFAGVLYHLRYPFWALKLIRDVLKPGGTLLLETAIYYGQEQHAMLYCPIENDSPYEPTSCTFFNRKGLVDTLTSLGFVTESVSVLHPDAAAVPQADGAPVVDRGLFVSQYTGEKRDSAVDRYWHGAHTIHTHFGGDSQQVRTSGALSK